MDVVRGVGKASDEVKGVEEDELQYKTHKARASQSNRLCGQGEKELVELLNTFENVWTFESCQGGDGRLAFSKSSGWSLSSHFIQSPSLYSSFWV